MPFVKVFLSKWSLKIGRFYLPLNNSPLYPHVCVYTHQPGSTCIISCLDPCSSLLTHIPAATFAHLQSVLHLIVRKIFVKCELNPPVAFSFALRMKSKLTALNDLSPAPLSSSSHASHQFIPFAPATCVFLKFPAKPFPTSGPLHTQLPLPGILTYLTVTWLTADHCWGQGGFPWFPSLNGDYSLLWYFMGIGLLHGFWQFRIL